MTANPKAIAEYSERTVRLGFLLPLVLTLLGGYSFSGGAQGLGIKSGDVIIELDGEGFAGPDAIARFAALPRAASLAMVVQSSSGATRTIRCTDGQASDCSGL
jgi:hypothetical protein